MNGYTLAHHFRKLRPSFSFSSIEADLFYELVALCNERGWPTEFQYPNQLLCATLSPMVESTLIRARNRLKQAGLLDFTSGHKRNPTVYRLLDPDAPAIPLPSASTSASTTASTSASTNDSCIIRKKTKRKTTPQTPAAAGEGEGVSFDDFWELFDKKTDRHKCAQRWASLSPADQTAALSAVPGYVASTLDVKYRKNPLTWLNGRCWLDTPANSQPAATSTPTPKPVPVARPALNADFLAEQQAREEAALAARLARLNTSTTTFTSSLPEPTTTAEAA